MPHWTWIIPTLALGALLIGAALPVHPVVAVLLLSGLVGAVIAAVYHAELVAHRVGEPFGTLVLALAITVIEASLIVALMLAGGEATQVGARSARQVSDGRSRPSAVFHLGAGERWQCRPCHHSR